MSKEMPIKQIPQEKFLAAISYIWILCLVPIIMKNKDEFVMHHAKQGLVLFIAEIALWIIGFIPFLGWIISFFGFWLVLVLSLAGIIKTLSGEKWEIPVLGQYAKKFNL